MNSATVNLENDHIHILRLIDVMERISVQNEISISHLETIVYIVRHFADGTHHAKEEKLLFPLMVQKGFSFEQGPIAVMMQDHEQGRKYIKGIADNIPLMADNKAALTSIQFNLRAYADLLRSHISKENNVLFRMADKILSSDEQENLLQQFRKAEKDSLKEESIEDIIAQIDRLESIY